MRSVSVFEHLCASPLPGSSHPVSSSPPRSQHVLLTGINGFIATNIVKILLERGYSVVGTVRSLSKADHIRKDAHDQGRLGFAVVKDITQVGAFDTVLSSGPFDAVLHTSAVGGASEDED